MQKSVKKVLYCIYVAFICVVLIVSCGKETSVDDGFSTGNIDFNKYYNKNYENIIDVLGVSKELFVSDAPDNYRSSEYIKYKGKDGIYTIVCKDDKVQMLEIRIPFSPDKEEEYQKTAHQFAVELYNMYKDISGKNDEYPVLGGGDNPKDWLYNYLDYSEYKQMYDNNYDDMRVLTAVWNIENNVQVHISLVNTKETNNAMVVVKYMKSDSVYAINNV